PPQDVVPVPVLVAEGGEDRQVEHTLEELGGIHGEHTTAHCEIPSTTNYRAASPYAMPSRLSCSLATTEPEPDRSMMIRRIKAPAPITSARPGCITGSARRSAT